MGLDLDILHTRCLQVFVLRHHRCTRHRRTRHRRSRHRRTRHRTHCKHLHCSYRSRRKSKWNKRAQR